MLRNRATVVGNLITASPANDTITPLLAMDASLVLVSNAGKRVVPLEEFYTGLRKTVLRPDEYVQEIVFKGLQPNQPGVFIKQSLRRAQAISVINCCVLLEMDEDVVKQARVTMGSVAPTVIHSPLAEAYLVGKRLDEEVASEAGRLAGLDAKPITDVRGSQDYRQYMVGLLVEDAVRKLLEGNLQALVPANPAVLDTHEGVSAVHAEEWDQETIETTINGETYIIPGYTDGTLLYMVRDRVGLTGTKVGCEEGECGACTLYLDGKAVVSCLVPAPRAHHARVTTIEGISNGEQLHPVQQAFVDHSAVQCGYCTPGFVMSAAKLLEENPHPDRDTIKYAISGNLCRCTGYYKIVEAIESVCMQEGRPE
jgi:carbon-monoxide dehydrogenase medium subunit